MDIDAMTGILHKSHLEESISEIFCNSRENMAQSKALDYEYL
jgi:hypothetical protein